MHPSQASLFLILALVDAVKVVASVIKPNIICVTETWLNSSVDSSLVNIPGYSVTRDDRCTRRGGGTAVFLQDNIAYSKVDIPSLSLLNCDCTLLDISLVKLFLICIYIPPNVRADDLQRIPYMVHSLKRLMISSYRNLFTIASFLAI